MTAHSSFRYIWNIVSNSLWEALELVAIKNYAEKFTIAGFMAQQRLKLFSSWESANWVGKRNRQIGKLSC